MAEPSVWPRRTRPRASARIGAPLENGSASPSSESEAPPAAITQEEPSAASKLPMSDAEMQNGSDDDLAYDPDQKAEERREVRREYRNLDEELSRKRKDMQSVSFSYLKSQIDRTSQILRNVKAPQEATLDARIFLQTVQLAGDVAKQNAQATRAFDTDEFIARLVSFMGGRPARARGGADADADDSEQEDNDNEDEEVEADGPELKWENVARLALGRSKRVSVPDFMLGPLAIEAKERVVKKRVAHEKVTEPERRPQELKEDDIQKSENETTKNVLALGKLLKKHKRINLFRFIVNPHDFAQSVENMFYLSFLIREGQCGLEIAENGEPIISTRKPPTEEDYTKGARKHQMVLTLEMETWRNAIKVFEITEPIIPSRPKAVQSGTAKWYG